MNKRDDAAVTAVFTAASRTTLWRMTAGVAATAVLAVLAGSSWTGSQAFASIAGARSVTATGYTPRQLEAAYGILPLLEHGTDGRGETVVLPELAWIPRWCTPSPRGPPSSKSW
jgi:hypothetical protein